VGLLSLILVANAIAIAYWAIGKSAPVFFARYSLLTMLTTATLIAAVVGLLLNLR
jgi:hypothetical protein